MDLKYFIFCDSVLINPIGDNSSYFPSDILGKDNRPIPFDTREKAIEFAKTLPVRDGAIQNTYFTYQWRSVRKMDIEKVN